MISVASIRRQAKCLNALELPAGITVSGLEADGAGDFYCGGAGSGKVRAVRKAKH